MSDEIKRLREFRDAVLREYDMQVSVIFPSIETEQARLAAAPTEEATDE